MIKKKQRNTERALIKLYAGESIIAVNEEIVETVIGGCVAVTILLYGKGCGGMTHFMLPYQSSDFERYDKQSSIYGVNALSQLITKMQQRFGMTENFDAAIIGGSNAVATCISANIRLARFLLEDADIRISKIDCGGTHFRRVLMDVKNETINVIKIDREVVDG